MENVSFIEVLKQLTVAVPCIIVGSQTLTSTIRGVFNIEDGKIMHAINWIIGALAGAGFVAFNGLTFGLTPWLNYTVGVIGGLIGAGASNGLYDWEKIKTLFNAITDLFGNLIHKENYYKVKE